MSIDVGDLDLGVIDNIDTADLFEASDFLEAQDFSLSDGDLEAITEDLAAGWDDVDTDIGAGVEDLYQSNFDTNPFDGFDDIQTFDDMDFGDFGDSFDVDFADF